MKKILFIGGTGVISGACVRHALGRGYDVTVLNRGGSPAPEGARQIVCDIADGDAVRQKTGGYDAVADFITYRPEQAERAVRMFAGRTGQYIFISSASVYSRPPVSDIINESTPLRNQYWQYARDKIACELVFTREYRESGFPVTIVRPAHTYNERKVPVAVHGRGGSWQVLKRIMDGRPVPVPGDGLTWWVLTHSADFATGFTGLLGNPRAIGEAVHITSDERLTWNTVYQTIGKLLGREPVLLHVACETLARLDPALEGPLLGDKACSVCFDNDKIKRLVPEFLAATRFDQGVAPAVEYVLTHGEAQIPDPDFDAFCDRATTAVNSIVSYFKN